MHPRAKNRFETDSKLKTKSAFKPIQMKKPKAQRRWECRCALLVGKVLARAGAEAGALMVLAGGSTLRSTVDPSLPQFPQHHRLGWETKLATRAPAEIHSACF